MPHAPHCSPVVSHHLASLPFRVPANDNTPAARRRILEAWRTTAPEKDSAIFHRRAVTTGSRMAGLAAELAGLMEWKRLRENSESDAVGSNWLAAHEAPSADNDNAPWQAPLVECVIKEDSAEALLRRLGDYETTMREDVFLKRDGDGGFNVTERRTATVITGQGSGEFERYPEKRFRAKPRSRTKLVAPGGLRRCGLAVFSGPEHRGQDEPPTVRVGTLGYLTKVGAFVPLDVDWDYVERTSSPPPAAAVADPDAIIDARRRIGRLLSMLGERDVLALDTALRAENFAAMGAALGHAGSYAPKAARRALVAACEALAAALEEIDAA